MFLLLTNTSSTSHWKYDERNLILWCWIWSIQLVDLYEMNFIWKLTVSGRRSMHIDKQNWLNNKVLNMPTIHAKPIYRRCLAICGMKMKNYCINFWCCIKRISISVVAYHVKDYDSRCKETCRTINKPYKLFSPTILIWNATFTSVQLILMVQFRLSTQSQISTGWRLLKRSLICMSHSLQLKIVSFITSYRV